MKVIPKTISNFVVTPGEKSVILTINESLEVEYLLSKNSNNEILQDLIEAKAFATALLYLNEMYKLVTNSKLFKENKVEDYYKDCNSLLKENVVIVEEQGIPLVSINGYNIYESDKGILRGNGKKKLKESFNVTPIDEFITGKWKVVLTSDNGKDDIIVSFIDMSQDKTKFPDGQFTYSYYLDTLLGKDGYGTSIDKMTKFTLDNEVPAWTIEGEDLTKIANWLKSFDEDGSLNEESGTQVGDIAPKVDQDMNGKTKKKEKKYYDILLSGIDESMDSILNKGFMKNIHGQYERDGYILIKENNKFIAVRKDKLIEGYDGQMSIGEDGLPELPNPYHITKRNDNRYQMTSSHPYDDTDYSWAVTVDDNIDGLWKVYEPNPDYSTYLDIDKRPAQNLFIDAVKGWQRTLDLLQKLDATKTTHIDRT